ncbi:MAG: 1-acyl-sn-glycerol-3-phosphate acyltransferase [Chitinophagaceae bacterium]|nr:1-acyl-sn-glycerol-3-phosphate acyltransferase [Chitinophagaceae bacterium]
MNWFKEIFARIWAVWGIISFITTFLLFFIPSMLTHLLPEPSSSKVFIRIARLWMDIWLFLIACPVRVKGKDNFKPGVTYIVTCNHNSLMDVPISSPYIPGANRTIAKTSFAKIPLFGLYYRKGSVLVDRKSDSSRKESFIKMKAVLASGIHMCIYPEGTRNKTNQLLGNFHSGAFKLSIDTGKSILPGIILHTKKVMPANKTFYLLPHRLEFHFLPAIEVIIGENGDKLRERTRRIMQAYLESVVKS